MMRSIGLETKGKSDGGSKQSMHIKQGYVGNMWEMWCIHLII